MRISPAIFSLYIVLCFARLMLIAVRLSAGNFNHPDGETNDISLEKIVEHASTDKENANSAWDSSMMELLQPARDSVVRDE